MTDFSDRPLYAGSVRGVRAFRVDGLGRLRAVHADGAAPWRPGENEAACYAPSYVTLPGGLRVTLGGQLTTVTSTGKEPATPTHEVGSLPCGCGFYAYFNGDNTSHIPGETVTGIIEGYGSPVVVGDKGFRAPKARIVALVDPGTTRPSWLKWWWWWGPHLVFLIPAAVTAFGAAVGYFKSSLPWLGAVFAVLTFALLVAVVVAGRADYRAHRAALSWLGDSPVVDQFAAVRRNYPDVPVFRTLDAALAEFPVAAPARPTPDTCDDFWTRRA